MVEKKERKKPSAGSAKAKSVQVKIKAKRKKLWFRGRFGKKYVHNMSRPKWLKWRRPRGIDEQQKKEDGIMPQSGFRSPKEIRGYHPSGYREKIVRNPRELEGIGAEGIARIASGVGEKKREQICIEAEKRGIRLLNH